MKRIKPVLIILIIAAMLLSGCALYNKEYVSVTDYVSPIQIRSDENRIIVSNFNELKIALRAIVDRYRVTEENIIAFDQNYDGDPAADISLACKQTITENAFCAYCVEDISYDIYKVVTYYEATITVRYAETLNSDIIRLSYSGQLKEYIADAIRNRLRQLIILLDYSNYNEDDIIDMVDEFYRNDPLSAPKEPNASVRIYSGSGKQKLYEINFDYGLSTEELDEKSAVIAEFVFPDIEIPEDMEDLDRAVYAVSWLMKHSEYSSARADNTAYSALIEGKANSQGLSMALMALCGRLGLDCRLVNGQKNWTNHYWNMIRIGDTFAHTDVQTCLEEGVREGFLLNDERMWVTYRWDMSGYPRCSDAIEWSESLFAPYLHEKGTAPDEAALPETEPEPVPETEPELMPETESEP